MKRRDDIDGLRAIAIISVLIFHAWPKEFKSGFIGVDIFFVISGYLISGKIRDDLEKHRFSFVNFYLNRAKRLFVPCSIVLTAVISFGALVLHNREFVQLKNQVVSSLLFLSNVLFWRESGYFDQSSDLKPLLHTWSLSLEEQFYVIYPFLLACIYRFKLNKVLCLSIIALSSFAICLYGSFYYSSFTFFMLPTRIWELLAGGIVAFSVPHIQLNQTVKAKWYAASGMALIILGFTFTHNNVFPGYLALLPVLGTSLVIAFGSEESFLSKFLSNKLFKQIGVLSYSLYLWHWPLLSYAFIIYGDPSNEVKVSLISLSFFLSYLTYRLIEKPFGEIRFHENAKKFRSLSLWSCASSLLVIAFLFSVSEFREAKPTIRYSQTPGWDERPWWSSNNETEFGCHKSRYDSMAALIGCQKNHGSKNKMIVVGDSHAGNWTPLLEKISKKIDYSYNAITAGAGCSYRPESMISNSLEKRTNCSIYNDFVNKEIVNNLRRGDILVLGVFARSITENNYKTYKEYLKTLVSQIERRDAHLVLMNDLPFFKISPAQCLKRNYINAISKDCFVGIDRVNIQRKYLNKALVIQSDNITIVDPTDYYCPLGVCSFYNESKDLMFVDPGHLSRDGSISYFDHLLPMIKNIIQE